ncbi:hypothetical protein GXW83_12475 [Streptacidiphilus sp. PB12-B1b]|uniref:hypothetical protein n=1 Tax=Streptacidiphilus sp. PB12-B1b TaxID=2705012 RepID=UPI0015FD0146|nr:hypothetical protein [Streptacidiphilus sp. PB12-B1b]QMU76435.1 hypothetical protein GXW83_12475 [Streptacidiphilus sp. PB12-B1b]
MTSRRGGRLLAGAALTAALTLAGAAACARHTGGTGGTALVSARSGTPAAVASARPGTGPGPGPSHSAGHGRSGGHGRRSGHRPGAGSSPAQTPVAGAGLDATAQRLAPYLQRNFGTAYASILVDDPHGQLVVFRLPDPRLDAAARRLAGPTRLAFVTARYSYARQHQLLARITQDLGYWRGHGVVVNSRGTTNGVHCAVIVTTDTGSAAQQRAFDARYGAGVVKVVEGGAIVSK